MGLHKTFLTGALLCAAATAWAWTRSGRLAAELETVSPRRPARGPVPAATPALSGSASES
jgi:hypothetical protein